LTGEASCKGYDSNRFRRALIERGIEPCIPSSKSRKVPIPYNRALYRQRHPIENMFGHLKDWRRIAMRYDRCAHTFMSAIWSCPHRTGHGSG
jgi:putative transposase